MERFRIRRLIHDQPYLRGEVETFPMMESPNAETVNALAHRVGQLAVRYIELIAEAAGLHIKVDTVPDTPQQVGYLAAVAMQIDNKEKQSLLDCASPADILTAELTLLNRENALLTWMTQTKEWPARTQLGPSGWLLPN